MRPRLWWFLILVPGLLGALDLRTEGTYLQGLTWAGDWDPAPSGAGFGASAAWEGGPVASPWAWEAGVEVGFEGLGTQILVPLGLRWASSDQPGFAWSWAGRILPGLTVTRPRPLVLAGMEALGTVGWYWSAGSGVEASTGLRLAACPEYSRRVATYELWDLPVKFGVVFRL